VVGKLKNARFPFINKLV